MAAELPNRNKSSPRVTEFYRAYIREVPLTLHMATYIKCANFRFIIRKYGNFKNTIYEFKNHRNKEFIVRNHRNASLIYNIYDKYNLEK